MQRGGLDHQRNYYTISVRDVEDLTFALLLGKKLGQGLRFVGRDLAARMRHSAMEPRNGGAWSSIQPSRPRGREAKRTGIRGMGEVSWRLQDRQP